MSVWGRIFVDHPWSALVVAALFALLWFWRSPRRRSVGLAITAALPALAWTVYAMYEWRMSVWSSSVVAPIRADLLVVIPLLLGVSFLGVAAMAGGRGLA